MREFLKAFLLIFVIVVAALGVLRYAPIAALDPLRQHPLLQEKLFPLIDTSNMLLRSVARDGVAYVPMLQEQQWLVNLIAESTEGNGDSSPVGLDEVSAEGRSPAGTPDPKSSDRGFSDKGTQAASNAVQGVVAELLGKKFEVLGQTQITSTALSPVDLSLPQIFSVHLREDSQIILWTIRSAGEDLFVVEVVKGAVDLRRTPESIAEVAVLLKSGAYKKLTAGERLIAAVVYKGRSFREGMRAGTRAEFNSFIKAVSSGKAVPGPAAPPTPAKEVAAPSNTGPTKLEDRAPAGGLEDNLQ